MKALLHRLRHWIGWAPCVLDVFDHPTIAGWQIGVLTCAVCGRQGVLFETSNPTQWVVRQIQ